jgi:RNA polymerase sigma factor (sigma-70 family)
MIATTTTMALFIRDRTPASDGGATAMGGTTSAADGEAARLTAAIARGEEAAFRQLYDAYQARLFRLALALGRGDESLAHETVQSVFLAAASKLKPLKTEEHLWNWLAQITRQNMAKQWRQRQRHSVVVSMADLPNGAEASPPETRLEESLDAALLALDADERQMIEWFYLDGLSQKEIAAQLNTTPKAVSSRLERARTRLRALVTQILSHET